MTFDASEVLDVVLFAVSCAIGSAAELATGGIVRMSPERALLEFVWVVAMLVVTGWFTRGSTVLRMVGGVLAGLTTLATVGTYAGVLDVLGALLISVPSWSASLASATKPVLDLPGAVILLLVLLPASATSVGVL